MQENNISYIKAPITNKTPSAAVSLEIIYEAIKTNPHYKKVTENYRDLKKDPDASEREKRKSKALEFDYITVSGTFDYVSAKGFKKHSGLICIDIDKLENHDEVKKVREILLKDKLLDTAMVFISPGGLGLKWIIPIPVDSIKEHEDWYNAISKYLWNEYTVEVDPACKDIARACFLSYDPEVYYNPNAKKASKDFLEEWTDDLLTIDPARDEIHSTGETPWDQYNKDAKLGELLEFHGYTFVSSDTMGDKYLRPNPSGGSEYSVIVYRDSGIGFVHSSECYPLPQGTITPARAFCLLEGDGDWKKTAALLKERGYGTTNTSAEDIEDRFNSKNLPPGFVPFWELIKVKTRKEEKVQCKVQAAGLVQFFEENLELGRIKTKDDQTQHFVQNKGNVLTAFDKNSVQPLVRDYLERTLAPYNAEFCKFLWNLFLTYWIQGSKDKLLDGLVVRENKVLQEDENTSYLYYKNGYLKITPDDVEFFDYSTLDNYIWEKDILDRDYTGLVDFTDSSFYDYCKKVTGEDSERLNSLKSAYGYLLHGFKDPSIVKAVIFIDENLSEDVLAESGGTGKSIAAKAVTHMRPSQVIDGKHFKPDSQFAFANTRWGDKIIFIDDLKHDFDFRYLYNLISMDFKTERKGKDPVMIPFEESPKLVMTTNIALKGNTSSYTRRQLVIEFAPYFNEKLTVKDKYGEMFFYDSSWDSSHWAAFDSFMIHCLQYYLKEGITEKLLNYRAKQVIRTISPEMFEYLEENIKPNTFYATKDLLYGKKPTSKIDGFRNEYPDYSITAKQLGFRFETWCNYKGYKLGRVRKSRSKGGRGYIFHTKDVKDDIPF